jgi:DNA-directed RNA polymerase subunit E'/Rpb7
MDSLVTQTATKHLQIPISEINATHKDVDETLLSRLQDELEGTCDNYGYVIPQSVEIIHKSAGRILSINACSKIDYEIRYTFRSLRPSPGDTYTCVVDTRSKMGIIAYVEGYPSLADSPILFIIPQPMLQDLEISYDIGDSIQVQVIESRIKYKNKQIQVVCKPV